MRTDRRTDMTKHIVAFPNFTKALKNAAFAPVYETGTSLIYTPAVWRAKDLPDIITKFFTWPDAERDCLSYPHHLQLGRLSLSHLLKCVWRNVESILVNIHTQLCEYIVVPRVKILTETGCRWILLKTSCFAGRKDGWWCTVFCRPLSCGTFAFHSLEKLLDEKKWTAFVYCNAVTSLRLFICCK